MRAGLPAGITVFERGWLSSNNILFIGRDQTALVDSGYATHADQTLALVANALGGRSLDRLFNTHLHSDHCGGNAALQARYPDLLTEIPPGEARYVAQWDEASLSYIATGQQCARFHFDGVLSPGTACVLGDLAWEVHAAPGHDSHAVILFEPVSRTLISADALWENGFGIAFPELAGEPSFADIGATLDLIESLGPLHVIPGHGRPFGDVPKALTRAHARLQGLSASPVKHARHAMKVLIKFKLLELQTIRRSDWGRWVATTPYFEMIRARFFDADELSALTNQLLEELIASGAAQADGELIRNN